MQCSMHPCILEPMPATFRNDCRCCWRFFPRLFVSIVCSSRFRLTFFFWFTGRCNCVVLPTVYLFHFCIQRKTKTSFSRTFSILLFLRCINSYYNLVVFDFPFVCVSECLSVECGASGSQSLPSNSFSISSFLSAAAGIRLCKT